MCNEKELIKAITQSYKKYIEYGPRSPQKLMPIHHFVAQTLQKIWGKEYQIHYLSDDNKELKVSGKYYDKDIDVTITKNKKAVMCLGIKFVTSNYKQNANNYFENMMGETANIQANKNLPYFQLIILRYETPYYCKTIQKNGKKIPSKIEVINKHDLQKYINLAYDVQQAHRPYEMGILLIDINETKGEVTPISPTSIFEGNFAELLIKSSLFLISFQKLKPIKNL